MDQCRIGLVGAGLIGEVHLMAMKKVPTLKPTAVCEIDEARLGQIGNSYGISNLYTDLDRMLEKEELDAILIATPDGDHVEPVRKAVERKIPIFLEKPIATTLEDGEEILRLVGQAKLPLMMGFVLRFTQPYRALRERILAGDLGKVTMAYAKRACTRDEARRLKGRCTVGQYLAVHDVDTMLWNLGTDVDQVYAQKGETILKNELSTDDFLWIMMRFRGGATAISYCTWSMPSGTPNYVESELLVQGVGGSAHLKFDGEALKFINQERQTSPDLFYGPAIDGQIIGGYRLQLEHFVECLQNGQAPLVGGVDGMNSLRIVLAAEESCKAGRAVPVELQTP